MEKGYLYFNEHLKPVATRVGGPAVRKKNKLVESPHPEPELTLHLSLIALSNVSF